MTVTHHSTLSAELRKIANSCDLGGLNTEWLLKATLITDLASYVQQKEQEAYSRGVTNGRSQPLPLTP